MKVVITGGTGLLGNALALDLNKDGHEVIVLSRNPEHMKDIPRGIQLIKWDGQTAQGWGRLADGADAVVNLAGENLSAGRWTNIRKRRIQDSRVNGGKAVVQAIEAAENKPKVVIQASAVGYYGITNAPSLPETLPPGEDFLAQVCRIWEDSTKPLDDMGIRRCVIRSGVFLSPKAGVLQRFLLPFRFFVGGPLGSGKQWLPWLHLQDGVRAIRYMIENPACSGIYNLAAPEELTNKQFVRTLGKVMRRPAIFPVPAFLLRLLFGEMSIVILEGQNVSVKRLLNAGFTFQYPQIEPALRNLLTGGA